MKLNPTRCLKLASLAMAGSVFLGVLLIRQGFLMPLSALSRVLCGNACTTQPQYHVLPEPGQWLNSDRPLSQLLGTNLDRSQTSMLIEKSRHRLTLYYQGNPIKSYGVVFGMNPQGDKLQEGDRRTPEGIFRIQDLYPHPAWSKFLWLDYPNADSWQKHYRAKSKGGIHWTATIGGEVGIHGVPAGSDHWIEDRHNWTWGCPSLKNQDVDELYEVVQVGTIVEILP